jgi:hypothetical protein
MLYRGALVAALLGVAMVSPAQAKKPAAEDEAAIRAMIEQVYAVYYRAAPGEQETEEYTPVNEYELPYSAALGPLIARWEDAVTGEELYSYNSFDWYCQCQDYDEKSARMISQTYALKGKDRIEANILFSPMRTDKGDVGEPLIFKFRREGGAWKLDDLKFSDGSTLRKGLPQDIKDATAWLKDAKP